MLAGRLLPLGWRIAWGALHPRWRRGLRRRRPRDAHTERLAGSRLSALRPPPVARGARRPPQLGVLRLGRRSGAVAGLTGEAGRPRSAAVEPPLEERAAAGPQALAGDDDVGAEPPSLQRERRQHGLGVVVRSDGSHAAAPGLGDLGRHVAHHGGATARGQRLPRRVLRLGVLVLLLLHPRPLRWPAVCKDVLEGLRICPLHAHGRQPRALGRSRACQGRRRGQSSIHPSFRGISREGPEGWSQFLGLEAIATPEPVPSLPCAQRALLREWA
mmetsp:Transcript_1830/g.5441  ORF Transcript_1830/g.5441 Transcript_1830/m.5441 type:complete len:272 (+) Transcript_1830:804-1619(+)